MSKTPGITNAELEWRNAVTPVSNAFDDVYFSKIDGAQESEYVFLQHNKLLQRWSQWQHSHFVVAETGFGTGLNFLLTWLAFREFQKANPDAQLKRLIFCSMEKYPLTAADLQTALACWPQLEKLTSLLMQQYPAAVPGCHRMKFDDGSVSLDLWLGDVNQLLPCWIRPRDGLVDAYFLDGFAPSKNPDMWSDTLYRQMARLARPGCTFATFTAAGAVRRGLKAVGFDVEKVPGFGTKREMLRGEFGQPIKQAMLSDGYQWPVSPAPEHITIVGGGIASAALASALVQRQIPVTLLCEDAKPAEGASGNRQGALYPLLHVEYDNLSEFFSLAFGFARRQIDQLIEDGAEIAHDWCGVVQLAFNDKSQIRRRKLLEQADYCDNLVTGVDAQTASELAGVALPHDALHYPAGGWLTPPHLVSVLLTKAEQTGLLTTHYKQSVRAIEKTDDGWRLDCVDQQSGQVNMRGSKTLVIANGHRCTELSPLSDMPVTAVRGQVSHVKASTQSAALKTVLCYEGYLAPMQTAGEHRGWHCLGASFIRNTLDKELSVQEQQENFDKLTRCIAPATWADTLDTSNLEARVGFRCGSRDHLPLLGPVHQLTQEQIADLPHEQVSDGLNYQSDLYLLTGLGSRGLCSAQYAAEILASALCREPIPASERMLEALHPSRIALRQARKNRG